MNQASYNTYCLPTYADWVLFITQARLAGQPCRTHPVCLTTGSQPWEKQWDTLLSAPKLHKVGVQDQEGTEGEIRSQFCNQIGLGSRATDWYLYTKPKSKLQQMKLFSSQQCSPLKHCIVLLPSCLALLGVQTSCLNPSVQAHVQCLASSWALASHRSWPSATHPSLGYSRSFEMELGTNSDLTTDLYLWILSIYSWGKSYFPHLWRQREVRITCPLTWDTFVFPSMNDFLKEIVRSSQINIPVKSWLS